LASGRSLYLPSGEYHNVGGQLSPILELDARLRETFDLAVGLEFDLPLGDELATSSIFMKNLYTSAMKDEQTNLGNTLLVYSTLTIQTQCPEYPNSCGTQPCATIPKAPYFYV
jgi:hypothetical protein